MIARRLAAAVAATALLGLVGPDPAGAAAVPRQTDAAGVEMVAVSQSFWVTREGTWQLRLSVSGAPPGATVTADIYPRVDDRGEYAESTFGVLSGTRLPSIPEVPLDDAALLPDGSREADLAVTLQQDTPPDAPPGRRFFSDGLRPGVYPVDVAVVGADGEQLDRLVTHITRVPSAGDANPVGTEVFVAPIVTLGSGPSVGPDVVATPDQATAADAEALQEGLVMLPDLPLTLVPRPESVEALARDEETQDGLAALQSVARARQVVDGTYVEVPVGAWVDAGLTDELARQRDRGNSILTEQLGRADSSTWDARSGLTPTAAAALWPVGVRTLILARGALGPEPVTGPVTVPAGDGRLMEAVVPDTDVSSALGRVPGDPVLNAAALAAELALISTASDAPPGIVVAPPDGWLDDPVNVTLLGQVLLDEAAPVEPVTVAQLLEQVPVGPTRQLAGTIPFPLGTYPERLGLARARLSSYATLVGADAGEVSTLDQMLLLSGSMALAPEERSAYVEEVLAITERRFQAVRVPDRQTVTLTSSDGRIPLTLLNRLDRPVTVTVDVSSRGRVEIRDFPPTQTLAPGTNRLSIPVHARAPGDSTIDIRIRTTDGEVDLADVRYTVRSTAVPGIGVVLSVGAVAFLLVWWARHWLRDRRARREGGDGGGGGGGRGPDDPAPPPDDPGGATAPPPRELVAT